MVDYKEKLQAWKQIMAFVKNIHDPDAKKLYHDTLLLRAINEWGFNPENVGAETQQQVHLTESDKEILEAIHAANTFGVNILADKKEETDRKTYYEMFCYVRDGGKLEDIPKHIRCDEIDRMYHQAQDAIHKDMMASADNVLQSA